MFSRRRSSPRCNLLPVVGILLVSSEWSQRTAQVSFTLVPRRPRVIAAKMLAGARARPSRRSRLDLSPLAATALAGPDVPGAWSLQAGLIGQSRTARW